MSTSRAKRATLPAILALVGAAFAAAGCGSVRLPDPDVIYVAFGDSATAGPADRDYTEYLADELQEDESHFANEGDSGESTEDGIDRLRELLDDVIFPNARVLLYWEGGNDLIDFVGGLDPLLLFAPSAGNYPFTSELDNKLDAIEANIVEAIELARDAGLEVFVATYYPLRAGETCPAAFLNLLIPAQAANANEYVSLLNGRIRDAAAAAGATLIDIADLGGALAADGANYEDCSHLSSAGNARVAGAIADAIR